MNKPNIRLTKPNKPANYRRDYSIIIVLACVPMPFAVYFDIQYLVPLLPIIIVVVLPQFWFRKYETEMSLYKRQQFELENPTNENESRVNENIARYQARQKERRAQAKWWQFWI